MERDLLPNHDSADQLIDEIMNRIDINRGEMSRLEFVRLLMCERLRKCHKNHHYADEEEIYRFIKEMIEMLSTYLEFLCNVKLSNITAAS